MQRTEPTTRAIDIRIEIEATPDAVWRALTEAEQLESWFPLNARVTPGVNGTVWVSWGGASSYEERIAVWEPSRHLRLVDPDADAEDGGPIPIAQDYFIEGAGGRTVLRFVHSGFSADTQWDDTFHTMGSGWRYFFFNLKYYLEHHAGTRRTMVWTRRPVTDRSHEQGWNDILGAFRIDPAAPEGSPYTLELGGEQYTGTVVHRTRHVHFGGTVPGLNDALLFIELEPGSEKWHAGVWLSTYSLPTARVAELQRQLDGLMDDVLA
jgi:uncharacterized protein YndB with AHSA1/START domain